MYVVNRGKVSISARVGAVEKVLSTLGQGEFFGEMSILNGAPRSATATCVEDCLLLVVDARTFEAMVRASSEIAVRMIQKMAGRLAEADRQIENLLAPRRPGPGGPLRLAARRRAIPARPSRSRPRSWPRASTSTRSRRPTCCAPWSAPGSWPDSEGAWTVPDTDRLRHFLDLLQLDSRPGTRP